MKTITFYSYKGGVGRSLTLANMATRLAEFGKSVCLIDFDLEAPGLHLKFQNEIKQPITKGLVNYIHSYAREGILPDSILPYSTRLQLYNNANIHLIPAGAIDSSEYWRLLSSIDWYNLVYENPNSISFFLDLKQKIKRELKPDFLLIDSRTGISEMSGITISLMADEVIIVSANNRENLEGSKRIINYLQNDEKAILGKKPRVSFVLSRIPLPETQKDKGKERRLIDKIKEELPSIISEHFFVLHSDRELEMDEKLKITREIDNTADDQNKSIQITKEYLELFEHITEGLLSEEEKIKFENIKSSEKLYNKAIVLPASGMKIDLLNTALQFNNQNTNIHFALGDTYIDIGNVEKGLEIYENTLLIYPNQTSDIYDSLGHYYIDNNRLDKARELFNKMIELFPDEQYLAFYGLGRTSHTSNQKEKSIEYYTMALKDSSIISDLAYNNRACSYMHLGMYDKALDDVYKALEIEPEDAISYMTLAEIYAMQDKHREFYLNFEIALSKNSREVSRVLSQEKIYARFLNEPRFIKLLEKYDVPLPSYDE